jgi:hypothetical protein
MKTLTIVMLLTLSGVLHAQEAAPTEMPAMSRNDGLRETIVDFGDEKVYTILKQSVGVHGDTASAWVYVHKTKNIRAIANSLTEKDLRLDDATKNDTLISLAFMMGMDQQQGLLQANEKPTDKQLAGVLLFSLAAERDTPETKMLVEVFLPNRTARIKQIGAVLTHKEFVSPVPSTPMIAVAACITAEAKALGLMTKSQ